jgi:hypothetical protein
VLGDELSNKLLLLLDNTTTNNNNKSDNAAVVVMVMVDHDADGVDSSACFGVSLLPRSSDAE